ncbi:MAG: universal stress protein, partial [Candidatus Glassbacteria bacterium]|nr:universal stress protein [Candidatus Glassbacteria bacterium]
MLAGDFGSELHLLHVVSLFNEGQVRPEEVFDEMEKHAEKYAEQLDREAHRRIDRKIEDHRSHNLEMFKHVERGFSPHEEIVRVAAELDVNLLVMGTYGRGGVAHFLFGSTAEQVVRMASCPVLTVRHHAPRSSDIRQIKNILFPTDFSEYSKKALPYALSLASRYGATLHVLHVFEQRVHPAFYIVDKSTPFDLDDDLRDRALDALDEFVYSDLRGKISFNCEVASGTPFVEIINFARAREIDLIVTATHGLTGLQHMIIGSTTERVLRKAPCPVLSVKDPEHKFVHP